MSIYLICLTYNGGLPIFKRCKGEFHNLPFSTVASLNGFHMFFKSLNISLHVTYADNCYYLWRDFNHRVTIIVCATNDINESSAELLTELVFGALSLFISPDDFCISNNILLERLKKESKNYIPIVDVAMELCINQLLDFSDCILANENEQMLARLNEFSHMCGSLFCCLLVGQKIAVATEGWWDLDLIERQLLLCLSISMKNEVPIYLPRKSPNMAYRFITMTISHNVALCIICGTEPTVRVLQRFVDKIFHIDLTTSKNLEHYVPFMSFPSQLKMDGNILAVIFASTIKKKWALCINTDKSVIGPKCLSIDSNSSLETLRKIFVKSIANINTVNGHGNQQDNAEYVKMFDQYWHTDSYKCYVQKDNMDNILCMLCVPSISTHTMKVIGMEQSTSILQNESYCW